MQITMLSNDYNIVALLEQLDVDTTGKKILAAKAKVTYIKISQLHVGAANILKQDALSVGADVAVPRGTIIAKEPYVDVVLLATHRAIEKLIPKLRLQPFGLQTVARYLQSVLQPKNTKQEIMGIINANDDSFYSGSRFKGKDAVKKINQMVEDGADIIDIGGVSSRPGAKAISSAEELLRVKDILETIYKEKLYDEIQFSIDSYTPEVIKYALDCGFCIVNDITGLQNDDICSLAASYNAKVIIMHMQGTPQTMQNNPTYENVVAEVYDFFQRQMKKAQQFGIKDIVLDIGIGFGKTLQHNIALLQNIKHFQTLQKDLLVGASRKSLIDMITPSSVDKRLGGSLAIHLQALKDGVNIVRVHDVYQMKQAWEVQKAIYG